MEKVNVDFENCYGIGKLEYEFDFSRSNTFLIYAPNGTMKTFLAKTLRYFANEDEKEPCDQIYPTRVPKFELKFDGDLITQPEKRLLIVDPDIVNYDATDKISNFIASKELKNEFDNIYKELDLHKKQFITKLKSTSQSSDCEAEVVETFLEKDKENFFDVLNSIVPLLDADHQKYDFRYNDIFDKKGNVKKFLEKHQSDLDAYITNYESLLSQSSFFKKSDNSFGTYQAHEILNSIEDNSFFEAGHSLSLQGDAKITSASDLKTIFEQEINKIVNDQELKKIFDKVDKAIGSNVELRSFKKAIEKNNLLLLELRSYEEFKKKVWLGYLSENKAETLDLHSFYSSKKQDLDSLLTKAKRELDIWKRLIEQFNARFYVPFTVSLANQEDVILKKDLAVLDFLYCDRPTEIPIKQEKDLLFSNVLSRGERRAFYILQILFDLESKKLSSEPTLVIFDDVADSFDYKNKYAIIEYIKDLEEFGHFKIIILTHNFDFYRTVAKRLNLSRTNDFCAFLMAIRNRDGIVSLNRGEYINDIFSQFIARLTEEKVFVSLVPFLRNIIEYTEGVDSTQYGTLTKCLHIKPDSNQVSVQNILDIWNPRFPKYQNIFQGITYASDNIIDLIYRTADHILTEQIDNEILLENKIVLSIATRLKAEEFMIASIPNLNLAGITRNQTQELYRLYKNLPTADKDKVKILGKVVLMTSENIHLNAFMYEPLIDIALWHLTELYTEVKSL